MNCNEARLLIHPYVDGELELSGSLELESHLQDCGGCAREMAGAQALRSALERGLLAYRAPAGLRKQVSAALREADTAGSIRRRWNWKWPGLAAGVAALMLVAVIGARLGPAFGVPALQDGMAGEVVASHARSLMADHLTDVLSSNQHTVKPWFAGKLDFSPSVQDLASQGFPLIGGRLDYLAGRPVAALIYRHQLHTINLFTWPAPGQSDTPVSAGTQQGYHLANWTAAGMNYWVVSDLNPEELQQFVQLLRAAPPSTPAP